MVSSSLAKSQFLFFLCFSVPIEVSRLPTVVKCGIQKAKENRDSYIYYLVFSTFQFSYV